jgi:predicted nucleic acid-binding protein
MNIKLNLKKHCVETELKRLYNRSLSQYFKPGSNQKQIEKILDVIKTVLENSNISNLRSKYPELSGNSEADILLSTDRQDQLGILINGLEINPFEKA